MPKTATIVLESVKDPDGWQQLADDLDLSDEKRRAHFFYGEYATIEIEVDAEMNIVGGRVRPIGR